MRSIRLTLESDGSIGAGLADEWGYVGDGNTEFRFTLRDDATFADGTDVTAQSVVDSFTYYLSYTAGADQATFASWTMTAVDDDTVDVTLGEPNPFVEFYLSNASPSGMVISPAGLADPDKL